MNEMKDAFLRTLDHISEKHILKWSEERRQEFKEAEESARDAQRELACYDKSDLEATRSVCQDFLDAFDDLQRLRRERDDIIKAFNLVQKIVHEAL